MSITEAEVIQQLHPIFQKVFSDSSLQVNREMSAKDIARWDSLTHMTMISAVEQHFGISFKLKELTKMKNVGDMVELIILKKTT
jgi:acyl carrier protein